MPVPHNAANSVRYKKSNLQYLPACILSGLLVYPLAIAIALPLLFLLNAIYEMAYPAGASLQDPWVINAYTSVAVSLALFCGGFAIGLFQKHLVMRYFNVNLAKWRLVSMGGACLAAWIILHTYENKECLLETMRGPLGDRYYNYYDFMLSFIYTPMIQFAFLLSAIQAIYLYRYARSAWLWLAANVAAGALFFVLFVYAFLDASILSWFVAAIAQALLVGYAMEYLMMRRRRGGKAKRKDF